MNLPVLVGCFVLIVRVGRSGVDAEFHAFDFLTLAPLEVHVERPDVELGEFPLEGGRLDAQITQGTHGHVAADAGETVEKEDAHRKMIRERSAGNLGQISRLSSRLASWRA